MSDWKEKLLHLYYNTDSINTDSDLEDFARENKVSEKDVFHFIAQEKARGTCCEGCKYVDYFPNMHPCSHCARIGTDYFQKEVN